MSEVGCAVVPQTVCGNRGIKLRRGAATGDITKWVCFQGVIVVGAPLVIVGCSKRSSTVNRIVSVGVRNAWGIVRVQRIVAVNIPAHTFPGPVENTVVGLTRIGIRRELHSSTQTRR